jgi:hypothetical protein
MGSQLGGRAAAPTPAALSLTLEVNYLRDVNWPLLRAGIPPLWKLVVHNRATAPATGLGLRLSLAHFLDTGEIALPEIPPGGAHEVDIRGRHWVRCNFEAAARLGGGQC